MSAALSVLQVLATSHQGRQTQHQVVQLSLVGYSEASTKARLFQSAQEHLAVLRAERALAHVALSGVTAAELGAATTAFQAVIAVRAYFENQLTPTSG